MSKTPTTNTIFALVAVLAIVSSGLFVWSQIKQAKRDTLPATANTTYERIALLESQLAQDPKNVTVALSVSELYLQIIRETGDAELYKKIESVLMAVTFASTTDARILGKRAEVAHGRHEFKEGLALITQALALDPQTAAYYGIKTDAETEMGLYDEAQESLQKMVNLKPNFSSYTRIAYQRELYGDKEGALEALAAAISSGSIYPENIAWAHVESGKLLFGSDNEEAEKQFKQALALYPNYAPALEGLGRIAYAAGNREEALRYFTMAFETLPIAQYATTLGEYYSLTGDSTKATQYYALADLAYTDAKGVNVDLEYALFLANHGDVVESLVRAKRAYEARPSIYGAHVYAWALHKNNKPNEAEAKITEALRLGEYDRTILTHASVIYAANNKQREAEVFLQKAKKLSSYGTLLDASVVPN